MWSNNGIFEVLIKKLFKWCNISLLLMCLDPYPSLEFKVCTSTPLPLRWPLNINFFILNFTNFNILSLQFHHHTYSFEIFVIVFVLLLKNWSSIFTIFFFWLVSKYLSNLEISVVAIDTILISNIIKCSLKLETYPNDAAM